MSEEKERTIKITGTIRIDIPRVPNFIKCNEQLYPIADFEERELKIIGREWTKNLISLAKQRRSK